MDREEETDRLTTPVLMVSCRLVDFSSLMVVDCTSLGGEERLAKCCLGEKEERETKRGSANTTLLLRIVSCGREDASASRSPCQISSLASHVHLDLAKTSRPPLLLNKQQKGPAEGHAESLCLCRHRRPSFWSVCLHTQGPTGGSARPAAAPQ